MYVYVCYVHLRQWTKCQNSLILSTYIEDILLLSVYQRQVTIFFFVLYIYHPFLKLQFWSSRRGAVVNESD